MAIEYVGWADASGERRTARCVPSGDHESAVTHGRAAKGRRNTSCASAVSDMTTSWGLVTTNRPSGLTAGTRPSIVADWSRSGVQLASDDRKTAPLAGSQHVLTHTVSPSGATSTELMYGSEPIGPSPSISSTR